MAVHPPSPPPPTINGILPYPLLMGVREAIPRWRGDSFPIGIRFGFVHRKYLGFGAIDFNSSAAAEEEVKNIAAAQHSGIKLDEVRFYNSALTSAEITQMYNYGKGDLAKVGGFSSVPSTIVGAAGSALSSTVTADFPNALYYAHNLPSGLCYKLFNRRDFRNPSSRRNSCN